MQYQIKWIKYNGKQCPVVLQVVNGPCPLIALCSVLFLRGELTLRPDVHEVSFEQLCELLRRHLQRSVQAVALRPGASEEMVASALQNLEEVSPLLPRLEQGLDVNVRFSSPAAFEFTPELSLFDLAGVRLLHGWCCDPEDRDTARVLSNMSYNELVNFITSEDAPPTPAKPRSMRDAAAAAAASVAATAPAAAAAPPFAAPSAVPSEPAAPPTQESSAAAEQPAVAAEVQPPVSSAVSSAVSAESLPAPSVTLENGLPAVASSSSAISFPNDAVAELKEDLEALHVSAEQSAEAAPPETGAANPAPLSVATLAPVEPALASSQSAAPASASTGASSSSDPAGASAAAPPAAAASSSVSPPVSCAVLEAKSLQLAQTYHAKNLARAFLNDTQSQLTIAGLAALHSLMRADELAVLFRNNHFSVLLKHNDRLYTLVSDFGLLAAAPYIVWSFVSDTQGDHLFLDHDWKIPHPTTVDYWARQDQRQPTVAMEGNRGTTPQPTAQQSQPSLQPRHQRRNSSSKSRASASPTPMVPGTFPHAAAASASAASSANRAPSRDMSVLEQQRRFAADNGLIWNDVAQTYQLPPPAPQQQPQQRPLRQHPLPPRQPKRDSCVVQ